MEYWVCRKRAARAAGDCISYSQPINTVNPWNDSEPQTPNLELTMVPTVVPRCKGLQPSKSPSTNIGRIPKPGTPNSEPGTNAPEETSPRLLGSGWLPPRQHALPRSPLLRLQIASLIPIDQHRFRQARRWFFRPVARESKP